MMPLHQSIPVDAPGCTEKEEAAEKYRELGFKLEQL